MTETAADGDDGIFTVGGGAIRVFGGRLVKLLLGVLSQIVMARLLGPTGYGGVVIAQVVIGVGALVATLGLDSGLTRFVPYHEDDPSKARGVVRAGLGVGLATGVVVGVAMFVAAPTVAVRVFDDAALTPLLRIAAVAVPFGVMSQVGGAVARGSGSTSVRVLVRQLLNPFLGLVLVTALLLAGFGAVGATVSVAATIATGSAVALWLAVRAFPYSLRGDAVPMRREVLAFSLPLLLSSGLEFLIVNTDTLLIGAFLASDAVGWYNVAFRLRGMGLLFYYPVAFLLPTVITRLDTAGDREALGRTYKVASKWMTLSTLPVFLLLFLFPGVVVGTVFGEQYLQATTALQVFAVSILATALFSANGEALVALGYNRTNLYVNAGAAATNLLLNVLLIPWLGILGAALASTVAFVGRNLVFSSILYWSEDVQPFSAAMLRPLVATLAAAGAGYAAFTRLVPVTTVTVVAVGVVFLACYLPWLVAVGAVEPEDERFLERVSEQVDADLSPLRRAFARLTRED